MSITQEQAMCDHSYDKKYYCKKCGYTNLNLKHLATIDYSDMLKPGNYTLQIDHISDLHLDFWMNELNPSRVKFQKQIEEFIDVIKPKGGDVLLLGGDQGHNFLQDSALLIELLKYYKDIIIVPGNHDMYIFSKNQLKKYQKDSLKRLEEMKFFCRQHEGLHYLEGDVIVIKGVKFGGIGMWHDLSFGLNMGYSEEQLIDIWKDMMNDSKYIFQDGKDNYNIPTAYGGYSKVCSFKPLDYFKTMKDKLDLMEPVDVMLTHYGAVVPPNLPEEFNNVSSTYYYFDGSDDVLRLNPKYWFNGHTHGRYHFTEHNTQMICNPLGYPDENTYTEIQSKFI